jgi:3-phosphoshikimate 1-carboxyvinyltransferase
MTSGMADLVVHPVDQPLRGIVPAPPHRGLAQVAAVAASLMAPGEACHIGGRGLGELPICALLRALGVPFERSEEGLSVSGVGLDGYAKPVEPVDTGSSTIALALAAGVLSALEHGAEIRCDEAAARTHLDGIVKVLRRRGAQLEGRLVTSEPGVLLPPLVIEPSPKLSPLDNHPIRPNGAACEAEKLAALTSGLLADGPTVLLEPMVSGDLPVRLYRELGAHVETAGGLTRLAPLTVPFAARDLPIPGDPDTSLMLLASSAAVGGESRVGVRGVIAQPSDAAALSTLHHAGAGLHIEPRATLSGQATANVVATAARPRSVVIEGEHARTAGASLPTLAAWAALAHEDSVIADVSADPGAGDQGRRVAVTLAAFGVPAHWSDDTRTLRVTGSALRSQPGATRAVASDGDGGTAMLAVVLALAARGTTRVQDANCIVARFPRFVGSLRAVGANLTVTDA